jgi:hypothetical protein
VLQNEPAINLDDLDNAPSSLPAVRKSVSYEVHTDLLMKFSVVADDKIKLAEENHALKVSVKTAGVLDDLIKPYANRAFIFMCAYCGIVGLLLSLSGFQVSNFHLDTSVLEFLVGSTAVTVIGLVGMVLTGIFVGARRINKN